MERVYIEGDIIRDNLNWGWIFFLHEGKLMLYPLEYYNGGKLNEQKGKCSFIHDPKTWDLSKVTFIDNIKGLVIVLENRDGSIEWIGPNDVIKEIPGLKEPDERSREWTRKTKLKL